MPAELVHINAAPEGDNYQRQQSQLNEAIFDCWRNVRDGNSDERALFDAVLAYTHFMERRTRAIEQTVRAILASDICNDEQRRDLLTKFLGRTATQRDMKVLTESEAKIIETYRRLDTADKQFFRFALKRLTGADLNVEDNDKGGA